MIGGEDPGKQGGPAGAGHYSWAFALPAAAPHDRAGAVMRHALALYEAALASPMPLDRPSLTNHLGPRVGMSLAELLDACHELVDC